MKHLKFEAKFGAMFEGGRTLSLRSRRVLPFLIVLAGISAPAGASPSARMGCPTALAR